MVRARRGLCVWAAGRPRAWICPLMPREGPRTGGRPHALSPANVRRNSVPRMALISTASHKGQKKQLQRLFPRTSDIDPEEDVQVQKLPEEKNSSSYLLPEHRAPATGAQIWGK